MLSQRFLKGFFVLFIMLFTVPSAVADTKNYRILLTNDDGIHAAGLQALVKALSPDYELIISAPIKKWGGRSHGTLLWEGPMTIEEMIFENKIQGYAVHGLPADAARFGIIHQGELKQPVDLLISGINHGENLGSLSHLSGTIGSAMEGPYYGIPAIAVSIEKKAATANQFQTTVAAIKKLIEHIRKKGLPTGTVLNVNVPENAKGMRLAPMDGDNVKVDRFKKSGNQYEPVFSYPESQIPYSDITVYKQGYIAVTPLNIDWTDYRAINTLTTWNIK